MIGKCNTGGKPQEEKTVTAGTSVINVIPSSGKTIKKVTVNPTPSQTKTVTPNQSTQTVTPPSGKLLSKVTVNPMPEILSEEWGSKHRAILNGGSKSGNFLDITIKCMTYYDGYWLALGNDSNGDLYKLYTANPTSVWTSVRLGTNRNYPVTGIACDGTNVWMSLEAGAYSNRYMLMQSFTNFITSNTTLKQYNSSNLFSFNDITYCDGFIVAIGTSSAKYIRVLHQVAAGSETISLTGFSKITNIPIKCCTYNSYVIMITSDGQYGYFTIPELLEGNGTIHAYFNIASGFTNKCVAQMGDYICVAGTKSDGTYLYYAKGTPGSSLTWSYIKISSSVLTPVGLAYVNGLYVMVYIDTDGKTRYWCSTDLVMKKGVCGIDSASTSFVAQAIGVNGNVMLVAGEEDTTISKFAFTVS